MNGAGEPDAAEHPDVEIDASATAVKLRALERPRTESGVSGERTEDLTTRENLPARLRPGRVYSDVRIHRRIAGRVAARWRDGD